jgi:phosphorylase kinase alpha/beta subunit
LGPDALAEAIFSHCVGDVREAPLVQEILIYLGGFVRSEPQLFDGILRVRTHYIIVAMRDVISETRRCNEADAMEYMMQVTSITGLFTLAPSNGNSSHARDGT